MAFLQVHGLLALMPDAKSYTNSSGKHAFWVESFIWLQKQNFRAQITEYHGNKNVHRSAFFFIDNNGFFALMKNQFHSEFLKLLFFKQVDFIELLNSRDNFICIFMTFQNSQFLSSVILACFYCLPAHEFYATETVT